MDEFSTRSPVLIRVNEIEGVGDGVDFPYRI